MTPTGVVQVKIYKAQYSQFDKQISRVNEDGTKTIVERSWFSKGTKLLVQGIRRGDFFVPKKRRNSLLPVISKIIGMNDYGVLELQKERAEV